MIEFIFIIEKRVKLRQKFNRGWISSRQLYVKFLKAVISMHFAILKNIEIEHNIGVGSILNI